MAAFDSENNGGLALLDEVQPVSLNTDGLSPEMLDYAKAKESLIADEFTLLQLRLEGYIANQAVSMMAALDEAQKNAFRKATETVKAKLTQLQSQR